KPSGDVVTGVERSGISLVSLNWGDGSNASRRRSSPPRDVEDREPVATHPGIAAPGDSRADLAVEARALRSVHGDMAREGVEQSDVLVSGVELLPDVPPHPDLVEETALLDLGGVIGHVRRPSRRPFAVPALADRVVDVLDLGEERVEPGGKRMLGAPER